MDNKKWFIEFVLTGFIIIGGCIVAYNYISHHINSYEKYSNLCQINNEKFEK